VLETLEGLPEGVVGIRATGRVTGDDYRTVFVSALDRALEQGGVLIPREVRVFGLAERDAAVDWVAGQCSAARGPMRPPALSPCRLCSSRSARRR
jgi:hypothetical protein